MRVPGGGLKKKADFAAVFANGKSMADKALILYWLPRDAGVCRVGFCVGKRLGKAVKRNRIKRLLRESWRKLAVDAGTPADLVFIARDGGVKFSLAHWMNAMDKLLTRAGRTRAQARQDEDHSNRPHTII